MMVASVARESNQLLLISGHIDFDNALALKQQGEALISTGDSHCKIDFSAVTHANSAALMLLLNWTRHAASLSKTIEFTCLPEDLLGVAKVSGIDQLLFLK